MLDYVFLQDLGLLRDSTAVQGKERRSRTQLMCATLLAITV